MFKESWLDDEMKLRRTYSNVFKVVGSINHTSVRRKLGIGKCPNSVPQLRCKNTERARSEGRQRRESKHLFVPTEVSTRSRN